MTIEITEDMKDVIRDALVEELETMRMHVCFNKKTNECSSMMIDDPRGKEYLEVLKSLGFSGFDRTGLKYKTHR